MKEKRLLFIIVTIALIFMAFLYNNERHIYQKQSQTAFNSLANEMGNELEIPTILLNDINEDLGKAKIEASFNGLIMDVSNVKVLLNVSRYGKGVSESESNDMIELMNFHEFLSQELFAMSFQFSDNGTLTEDQHNDLVALGELFFDIRSNLNENEGKTDGFNIWYTTIMAYKGKFSDTGLISNYYE